MKLRYIMGFVMVATVMASIAFLFFSVQVPALDRFGRNTVGVSKLSMIGKALNAYRDDWGTLPPPRIVSKDGEMLCSWRTIILPYLPHQSPDIVSSFKDQYSFTEPWDSAANLGASELIKEYSRGWSGDSPYVHYLAVLDENYDWIMQQNNRERTRNPVAVIQFLQSDAFWTEPRDLILAGDTLVFVDVHGATREVDPRGLLALRLSGEVCAIPTDIEREMAITWLRNDPKW